MTLLAKINYARNASRRLPQALRVFKHYESSNAENAVENYVHSRRFLSGNSFSNDLQNPSLYIRRTIATGNTMRLSKKSSSKDNSPKASKSKTSTEDSPSSNHWTRMDHDCKKVTKLLLAQAATAPIRQAKGPHEISHCSRRSGGGRCTVPGSSCTSRPEESSYSDNPCDVDHVKNKYEEKEEVNRGVLHTQLQADKKDFESISKKASSTCNGADLMQDVMALSSVYITPTSCLNSKTDGGDTGYVPPFFHIVDKWKEHDQNQTDSTVRMESNDDNAGQAESQTTEFRSNRDVSNKSSKPAEDNIKGQDKNKSPKQHAFKPDSNIKKRTKVNQTHQQNPIDTIPILGTTLTPSMKSDKTPPPKVDCQIQVADGGKGDNKDQKTNEKASKGSEDAKKDAKGADSCKSPNPTGPKCQDGKKAQGDSKGIDCSKSGQDAKQKPDKDKGGPIDCSKYKTGSKDGDQSKSQEAPEKGSGSPIDCSKFKSDTKGKDQSKENDSCKKETGSQIDCSKYKSEAKGEDQSKSKEAAKKDSGSQIDCSKYTPDYKADDKSKSKETSKKDSGSQIDCSKFQSDSKEKDPPKNKEASGKDQGSGGAIDCSKLKSDQKGKDTPKDKEASAKDKGSGGAIDCSRFKSDSKGKDPLKDKEASGKDKGSGGAIDCSKLKSDQKGKDTRKDKEASAKDKGSAGAIDCSKFKSDPKGKDAPKDKEASAKDKGSGGAIDCSKSKLDTKDKDSKEKDSSAKDVSPIDCNKYKVAVDAKASDKSKDAPKKVKDSCLPCGPKDKPADSNKKDKPKVDTKSNKPIKPSAPTIKGCGGVTLESGEKSIDCSAIKADKGSKDDCGKKPDASKKADGDKKIDCSKKPDGGKKADDGKKPDGDKKAPIDCSNYSATSDGQKKDSGPKDAKKSDSGSRDAKKADCASPKPASKESKKDSKADSKAPPPIDCSKYQKKAKSQPAEGKNDSKKGSGDPKKGSSTGKGICADQKGDGDSKSGGKSAGKGSCGSSKSSGGSSTSILKAKDCRPVMCTKTVKKPKKPDPPKVDPAKRIKVQETPKPFNCCLKITGPEKVAVENCPMPELDPDNVIIRMSRLGLCASDVFMYNQGMQKIGGGDVSLGHEGAGVVVEVGSKVSHLKRGDGVVVEPGVPCGHCKFCRSGRYNICPYMKFTGLLSTYVSHPAKFCHKVKKSTKLDKAALAHPLSLALHSCKMGNVSVGSKVLILGACPRGLSTVMAARTMGADKIAVIDTLQRNLKVASELCADISIVADSKLSGCQLAEKALAEMKCRPNVVIDCCGCSKTVKLAINAVEQGGRCVLAGCQAECAEFPILPALAKEISYKTSFRLANMFPRALNLIETGRANVEKMITHRVEFCEAQNAFHCASKEDESGAIKVMIKWPKEKEEEDECKSKQKKNDSEK